MTGLKLFFLSFIICLGNYSSLILAQSSQFKDVASDLQIPTEEQLFKDDPDPVVMSAQIAVRLKKIQRTIQLDYNDHVQKFISYNTNTKRQIHISKMLGRAQKFFPVFEPILAKYGVPDEMKYLAVVESALNPFAVSPKGATGLWQFMYSTGLRYDLSISKRVDERKDPYLACEAAAKYLKEMYNLYGSWQLAIASYNCGAGNVNRAIKKAGGSTNFWDIRPYLPSETRSYVPSYIAVVYAMKYAGQYGISPQVIDREETQRITLREKITVNDLEKLLDIPRQIIIDENPSLLTTLIPANFTLNLPKSKAIAFNQRQDSLYNQAEDITVSQKLVTPQVIKPSSAPKESPQVNFPDEASSKTTTASKSKKEKKSIPETTKPLVSEKNKITKKTGPSPPQKSSTLNPVKTIPNPKTIRQSINTPDFNKEDDDNYKVVIYTVKKGDNLGYIASWYHCKVKEIRKWNELNGNYIDVEDELIIYVHKNDYAKFVRMNYLSNRLKDILSNKIKTQEELDIINNKEAQMDSTGLVEKIKTVKIFSKNKDCFEIYKIRQGENLWTVAQKYDDVTVQNLLEWNGFKKTPLLHKGDEIKVRKIPCK